MTREEALKVLGLRTPDPTPEQVRRAYRKRAAKHHPDRNPGNDKARARFEQVQEAHAVLSGKEKEPQVDAGAISMVMSAFDQAFQQMFDRGNLVERNPLDEVRSLLVTKLKNDRTNKQNMVKSSWSLLEMRKRFSGDGKELFESYCDQKKSDLDGMLKQTDHIIAVAERAIEIVRQVKYAVKLRTANGSVNVSSTGDLLREINLAAGQGKPFSFTWRNA